MEGIIESIYSLFDDDNREELYENNRGQLTKGMFIYEFELEKDTPDFNNEFTREICENIDDIKIDEVINNIITFKYKNRIVKIEYFWSQDNNLIIINLTRI